LKDGNCPEYNGYNTRICREEEQSLKPKTAVVYRPMLDRPPADPVTLAIRMRNAQILSAKAGQNFVVFTADQQLYRVALHTFGKNLICFTT